MITFRVLRRGLSGWAQCHHKDPSKREAGELESERADDGSRGQGDGTAG